MAFFQHAKNASRKIMNNDSVRMVSGIWIGSGAIAGGITGLCYGSQDIFDNDDMYYEEKYPLIEYAAMATYAMGKTIPRIALGSLAGASFAATAPISIPVYSYYRHLESEKRRAEREAE